MLSLRSFSKTSILLAVIAGIILVAFAGYYAFNNGIFADTSNSPDCKVTLNGDIKISNQNYHLLHFFKGPINEPGNLITTPGGGATTTSAYLGGSKYKSREIFGGGPAVFAVGRRLDDQQKVEYVKSNTFNCTNGRTYSVKADLVKDGEGIVVTETGVTSRPGVNTTEGMNSDREGIDENIDNSRPPSTANNGTGESPQESSGEMTTAEQSLEEELTPATNGNLDDSNDPGSSYIGEASIFVYSDIASRKIPVISANVQATTEVKDSTNNIEIVPVGNCQTKNDGTCDLKLNAPSTNWTSADNFTISYVAEKGASLGNLVSNVNNSLENKQEIKINGLTEAEAGIYQDWSISSDPRRLPVPLTGNFPGGDGSITIVPTRYTQVGGKDNVVAVGGVKFSLEVYYEPRQKSSNQTEGATTPPPIYRTSVQSMALSTRRSLEGLLSSATNEIFKGTIPDNGASSRLTISNLPAGYYLLTLSKDNFVSPNIEFELSGTKGENKLISPANLIPKRGAEPPAINIGNVRKVVNEDIYWVSSDGVEYTYRPDFPWLGWQNENSFIYQEPTYSIENNNEPVIPVGSRTSGGYDTPWGANPGDYADYMRRCQNMNFGRGVDPKNAALAAVAGGLGNWLGMEGDRTLGTFAETTLLPGITTFFAARAMQESGGSINFSNINADCFPFTSPYNNQTRYNPSYNRNNLLQDTLDSLLGNQNRYYPNGYPTTRIPTECRSCLRTPGIMYDPNYCPPYCRNYLNYLNLLPLHDLF